MKLAIYAIRYGDAMGASGEWRLYLSINLMADSLWWREQLKGQSSGRLWQIVLISANMPLSWAYRVQEDFASGPDGFGNEGSVQQWEELVRNLLIRQIRVESGEHGMKMYSGCVGIKEFEIRRGEKEVAEGHLPRLGEASDVAARQLAGRQLLAPEAQALLAEIAPEIGSEWTAAVQLAYLAGRVSYKPALAPPQAERAWRLVWRKARREQLRCRRCGSMAAQQSACAACGSAACAYCEACLALGRSRACALLLEGAALPAVRGTAGDDPAGTISRWGLSPAQSAATGAALAYLAGRRGDAQAKGRFLLWAVTGAGKTEMTYPLLDYILSSGGSVLVATPRRDVVLELAPRVARAFPDTARVTLYGGSSERWQRGQLTLATTHQLLRFRHAFDLVIIDELDAFPYHNDPMLAYAAEACCKPGGSFIYLSATPPAQLQREAARGTLAHARVPVRFHRHPLPVPILMKLPPVAQQIKLGKLPRELLQGLARSLDRGAQVFVFVTRIAQIETYVALLRRALPDVHIEGTSSEDPLRGEKVLSFRDRKIRLLVTTTILERGVTVPKSDVYILDANTRLFDDASLVQMAGRAGRSKDDPAGTVVFGSPEVNRSQKIAVRQIKRMNAIARRSGFLTEETALDLASTSEAGR
ncbi:DEAD/DEAH box helicase family protein [Neobacillus mesonae]|nr:DEAD/DEAH box helicase family protein [Neobacillus mesonae]